MSFRPPVTTDEEFRPHGRQAVPRADKQVESTRPCGRLQGRYHIKSARSGTFDVQKRSREPGGT